MNTRTPFTKFTERLTPGRVSQFAVAVVAAVAAVVSYAHMQQLAAEAGEGWRSHLLPLSVDGLLIAAAGSMVVARLHDRKPSALAWTALTLGIVASLAANVAAAEPTMVGRLVAAWSPLALALSFELLMQQIRHTPTRQTASAADATRTPNNTPSAPPAAPTVPRADGSNGTPRPTPKRATPPNARRATRPARAGRSSGGQAAARVVFERAVAEGRAEEMTGAKLAGAVGASPGAARKWLAAFRAEHNTTTHTTPEPRPASGDHGQPGDRESAEAPRLAVVGQSYPGGEA